MRRRLSLTAALVLLLSLLCACAAQHAQEMDENGYELYFLSDPNSAGGGDAIRTQEKRLTLDGAMETEDCVRALMEALLAGPDEPSLSSPIPEGTALKSLKVSGRRAQIDLSAQYARLTGIDLSLADYCITLTLTQLPNVNAVSITADGRELPYRETQVLLSADTLLSSRESGLRPITVSLYFLDSKTGELRAEQQTLALYEGQTRVNALLEALAQGPEDDSLVSLLPEDFTVISSRIENGVCYLNLPANVSLPEDEAALAKAEQYEKVLKQQNALEVLEKTRKLSMPFVSGSGKGKAYMEQLIWGELGDLARQLIRKENDGGMGTGRTEPSKKASGAAGSDTGSERPGDLPADR